VQLRLLRQRVVMADGRWQPKSQKPRQKAQADVLLHRLHHALPGWDAAAERRDAQGEFHSAAQARAWADGDFGTDHGLAFDGVRPHRGGGGGCARALAVHTPPPPPPLPAH
jgi:hypothetical protein